MDINNIITKSILETNKTRVVENSAAMLLQRQSSTSAEHVLIEDLISFISDSSYLDLKVKDVANRLITTAINAHNKSNDPHGDRAYTNTEIIKHVNTNDPHGNNLYTNQAIINHTKAEDPHGDRLFTATAIDTHSKAKDPHGDRAYNSEEIIKHSKAEDPHGDRLYSFQLLSNHVESNDPHGDRSYATQLMNNHTSDDNAHDISNKINSKINEHNLNEDSHNLKARLASMSLALKNDLDNSINKKIGVTIAPLEFGLVPQRFITNTVLIDTFSNFPVSNGSESTLYIDKNTKVSYIYQNKTYQPLNTQGGSNTNLTTDSIPAGLNLDRQYVTRQLLSNINSKVSNIRSTGSGISLISVEEGSTKEFKSLSTDGSVYIEDRGTDLVLKTNDYNFTATYDKTTLLTSTTDILKNINKKERLFIKGTVIGTSVKNTNDSQLIESFGVWEINSLVGTIGKTESIISPSKIVQSSNGIVITGTGVSNTIVEVYSASNDLLGTSNTIESNTFSITLNTPILSGEKLKLYTVTLEGNRSQPAIFYSLNTTAIKDIDCISYSIDGSKIRGKTSRGSNIEVSTNTKTILGNSVADINGNFTVDLNTTLKSDDTIVVTAKLGAELKISITLVVKLPVLDSVHDIILNDTNTVLVGKAEPSCLVTMNYVNSEEPVYTTSTNVNGEFTIFTYSNKISNNDYILNVVQDARKETISFTPELPTVLNNTDPIVKDILLNEETKIITSSITNLNKNNNNLNVNIAYNDVTKEVEIIGINTEGVTINWEANLNIIKYKRED